MSVTHLVLMQFLDGTPLSAIKDVTDGLLALKNTCISPTTHAPYILSVKGGKDNSPEHFQSGITHAFVVAFASAADRDYYSLKDPVHLAYGKHIAPFMAKVIAVDFIDGAF